MSAADSIGDPAVAERAAFFSVSNERDFVAVVALVNSLRAVGHEEPFYLADCGLTDEQRAVLRPHMTLLDAPTDVPPPLLKTYGPLVVDPDIAVILDADVIVVRPLTELVGERPVFFRDPLPGRYFPEWSNLGFGPVDPVPYVNSGHMIVSRTSGFLPRYKAAIERVLEIVRADPDMCRTPADPFYLPDQDALNALLGSMEPQDYVVSGDAAYWPFKDGVEEARLLHHILLKPWLNALRPTAYSRRMVALLARGPVVVPQEKLPVYLRQGRLGALARAERSLRHGARTLTRGRIGLRARLGRQSSPYLPELKGR